MIKSLKLFKFSVQSMRTAQKEYQVRPTPANKSIMEDLENKVDAWLKWLQEKEDSELVKDVPPFVRDSSSNSKGFFSREMLKQLEANHTPEEIERFSKMMKGLL